MSNARAANDTTQLFSGLCICTTGLAVHVKEQIRKIVLACGGAFEDDLTLDATTHLIADAVGSHKHRAAATKKLPIVCSRWIFDSFRAHQKLEEQHYALRILEGFVVCTTGLSTQTRTQVEKLVQAHGGVYDANLEVGRTNALIAQAPTGAKYDAALAHGISVVHVSWLHACIEKQTLVEESSYSLDHVLRPRRLYKQLRQDLDDLMGGGSGKSQLSTLIKKFSRQENRDQEALDGLENLDENESMMMELCDACGFFLLGFPPEMEKNLQFLIRMAMGTIYYEMQLPAVSHVLVSPVLADVSQLEAVEQQVVMENADASVHFVSAKWLLDSIKCLRLEPEEMYPVEIEEDPLQEETQGQARPAPAMAIDNKRIAGGGNSYAGAAMDQDVSMEVELLPNEDDDEDCGGGEGDPETTQSKADKPGKLFHQYGFLLVCLDPEEPILVRPLVHELQKKGGAICVVALDVRDVDHVDAATQFDFVTHVVVCSGVSMETQVAQRLTQKYIDLHNTTKPKKTKTKKKIRFVSDLWVRCCLSAGCVLSHQSHELFALTVNEPRSMFPLPLPLPCFQKVVASTSVYVGVDRLVVMEMLQMAGAKVTTKLSKRNSHLICLTPIGMKFEKASQWKVATVTARWVVQSVLQGELLDPANPDFQVLDDNNARVGNEGISEGADAAAIR